MKSYAPSLTACTARSIEPCAVRTIAGTASRRSRMAVEQRETVHLRHLHVEDDEVDPAVLERLQRLDAVAGLLRCETLETQPSRQRRPDVLLVVDDQDGRHRQSLRVFDPAIRTGT